MVNTLETATAAVYNLMKESLNGREKMTRELHVCTCLLYSLLGCIKKRAKFLFLVAFSVIFIFVFFATNIV